MRTTRTTYPLVGMTEDRLAQTPAPKPTTLAHLVAGIETKFDAYISRRSARNQRHYAAAVTRATAR